MVLKVFNKENFEGWVGSRGLDDFHLLIDVTERFQKVANGMRVVIDSHILDTVYLDVIF